MEHIPYFLAVDLGATSGRTILGSIEDGKLKPSFDNLKLFSPTGPD